MDMKALKKELKKKTDANPEKYYAVDFLKERGYIRGKCKHCGVMFWSQDPNRNVCGEPDCSGGYTFIDNPIGKPLDFIETWKKYADMFQSLGYTPIDRYPVAARWRDDTDFVQASIYDFQPHVVSGAVEPPANPLVVPQYCLRFNDIDNVGITGRHKTGFIMVGQHAFTKPDDFNQNRYLSDKHKWLTEGLSIPEKEIIYMEQQWGGGGNLGVCMEFFTRGLEIGNQVYMLYKTTDNGYDELPIKVLDMGMGLGRCTWLSQGTTTQYESDYPTVCKKLFKETGYKPTDIFKKFMPLAGELNMDENANIDKTWNEIAGKLSLDIKELMNEVLPLAGLFSVADHSQSLMMALTDGVLPSNVGGGYNLRVITRRAMSFIKKYDWSFSLGDVAEWHADYMKGIYPELNDSKAEVRELIEVEEKKYQTAVQRTRKIVKTKLEKKDDFSFDELKLMYESQGIMPELIKEEAEKIGKEIHIPDNFYSLITQEREDTTKKIKKKEYDLEGIPDTEKMFYDDNVKEFDAKILKQWKEEDNNYIVLDKSAFYPLGGGQHSDKGLLNESNVVGTIKQGNIIIHITDKEVEGNIVHGKIDWERRLQLTRQHDAIHIINGAARKVLGNHIYQSGAEKTVTHARLDITHYEIPSDEQLQKIEKLANKAIKDAIPISRDWIPRTKAEQMYGFRLYQGGAVPGKEIRVVNIKDFDVEACAGTHFDNTKYTEQIKILRAKKIQDGVVRLEITAGKKMIKLAIEEEKAGIEKHKGNWIKKVNELIKEKKRLTATKDNIDDVSVETLIDQWKQLTKELEKIKKDKASNISEDTVQKIAAPDMKLMQEIARRVAKKKGYCVVIAPGQVVGVGEKVKKAVQKAAEMFGGQAGGKNKEYKGGGPNKNKTEAAYELVKVMLS